MKCAFHFRFAMILLLLIAMAQGAPAQQSADAPPSLSQLSCQQIAVIGAVQRPSRLDAPLGLGLLEALGRVGGPTDRAGRTIRTVHTCPCSACEKLGIKAGDVNEYNLVEVLRGRENGNPFVVPGDIVSVAEADAVFVIGNVIRGRSIIFSEGMTVTRAIAMVGGLVTSSDLVAVRIHRTSSGAARQDPIIANLRSILKRGTQDVLLQPWDIVEVSDELGHFQVPRASPPSWDPPLPKWNPPPHRRKETSGSTLIAGASLRGSAGCIDSARLSM